MFIGAREHDPIVLFDTSVYERSNTWQLNNSLRPCQHLDQRHQQLLALIYLKKHPVQVGTKHEPEITYR